MNEKFLGDEKDFVKYDLLLHLGEAFHPPGGLTVIPMLTKGLGRKGHESYEVGARDAALHALLSKLRKNIKITYDQAADKIEELFASRSVDCRFEPRGMFDWSTRPRYFADIPSELLSDSIVFLDPDIGLEGKSVKGAQHLRYLEMQDVFARMSETGILVVYQHKRRQKWQEIFADIGSHLQKGTSITWAAVAYGRDVAFVVAAPSRDRFDAACAVLKAYARKVGLECFVWDVTASY